MALGVGMCVQQSLGCGGEEPESRPSARDELEAGSRRGLGCHPSSGGGGGAQCTDVPLRCHLPSPCPSSTPSGRSAGLGPRPPPLSRSLKGRKGPFHQRLLREQTLSCLPHTQPVHQQPHPLGPPPSEVDVVRGLAVKARLQHIGPAVRPQSVTAYFSKFTSPSFNDTCLPRSLGVRNDTLYLKPR